MSIASTSSWLVSDPEVDGLLGFSTSCCVVAVGNVVDEDVALVCCASKSIGAFSPDIL